MKKLFLAVALSAVFSNAFAQEVKVDFGVTKFTQVSNGNWYQEGFPYTLRLTSPTASIKIFTDKGESGWQYGLGFDYMGRVTSDAMVLDSDANYNANSPTHCNGPCGPLSHMQGQGTIPSAFLAARKNYSTWFYEVEGYATRPNYENTNYDWYGGPNNSVGPLVSHIDHQVKTTYGLGLALGYRLTGADSVMFKLIPTEAKNSQSDPLAPSGTAYYKAVYDKESFSIVLEHSF